MAFESTGNAPNIKIKLSLARKDMENLFDCIARHYDVANTVMSLGRHHFWRKFAIAQMKLQPREKILDLCCGTGMIASELARQVGPEGQVTGLDLSAKMLAIAKKRLIKQQLSGRVRLVQGDASRLPFPDNSFDGAIIGYGLRNVCDPEIVLREMCRVIKPGGRVVALEMAKPFRPVFREVYYFYLKTWIPLLGRFLCHNQAAYQYLRDSIIDFPSPEQFINSFGKAGFRDYKFTLLTFGVVAIYTGIKP